MEEKLIKLEKQIKNIDTKLSLMASVQMLLVGHIGDNDKKFQNSFIATCLAKDEIRNSFTDFIFETGSDLQKSMIQELNLKIEDIKGKKDNE